MPRTIGVCSDPGCRARGRQQELVSLNPTLCRNCHQRAWNRAHRAPQETQSAEARTRDDSNKAFAKLVEIVGLVGKLEDFTDEERETINIILQGRLAHHYYRLKPDANIDGTPFRPGREPGEDDDEALEVNKPAEVGVNSAEVPAAEVMQPMGESEETF